MDEFNKIQDEPIEAQNQRITENFSRVMDAEFTTLVDEMRKKEEQVAINQLASSIEDMTNLENFIEYTNNNTAKWLFVGINVMIVLTIATQSEIALNATLLTSLLFVGFAMLDVSQKFGTVIDEERHKRLMTKAKELEAEKRLGYKFIDKEIDPVEEKDQKLISTYGGSVTDRLEEN